MTIKQKIYTLLKRIRILIDFLMQKRGRDPIYMESSKENIILQEK